MRVFTVFRQLDKGLLLPFVKLANIRIRKRYTIFSQTYKGWDFYNDHFEKSGDSESVNNKMEAF